MTDHSMTAAQFNAKPKKRAKYGAKKTTVDGIKFDSKAEALRWLVLKDLEKAGDIQNLERQVKIPLWGQSGAILTDSGKKQRTYVADFRYVDWRLNGVIVIEDKKGFETPEFKLKRAILEAQNVTLLIT